MGMRMPSSERGRAIVVHPWLVRVTHWINAAAITLMLLSGWGIYNASPLFGFTFPRGITLGGWLGGSIAWHFAAMWMLVVNGLIYVIYGLVSGHFARSFLPLGPRLFWRDARAALRLQLVHQPGGYNAVQRSAYVGVLLLGVVLVLSGLSLWKPVQLQELASLMGGYERVRRVHFLAMAGLALFIFVHLLLVALVPRTLPGMITGRVRTQP
jgi:thiosulfate reductase cytochrome b subunit